MAPNSRAPVVIPILIVVVGVGWLLTALGVGPGINWVWTLGLGFIGIMIFVVAKGVDKVSVVLGMFFLLANLFSVLRQIGQLSLDIEVPLLVISIGVLLLIAQLPVIPKPGWYEAPPSLVEEPSAPKKLRLEDIPRTRFPGPAEGGRPAGFR
jgi:hypothetical protein